MSYTIDKLIGWAGEGQGFLIGRSNEEIPSSQTKKLIGYIINANQGCLIGYALDGYKLGAFDKSFN